MLAGSTASLPHSEAVVNSAVFSGSTYSSCASSVEPHGTRYSRRASESPPLRSVDVTEAPHDGDDKSELNPIARSPASVRNGSDCNSRSRSLSTTSSCSNARQDVTEPLKLNSSDNCDMRHGVKDAPAGAVAAAAAPAEGRNDGTPPAAAHASTSASTSPETLLALLSPEQLETALQLYVDRGGIHAYEVAALLTRLPFIDTSAVHPSHALSSASSSPDKGEDAEDATESSSSLLDPEGWLCAVAVAATADAGAAAADTPDGVPDNDDATCDGTPESARSPSVHAGADTQQPKHRYPLMNSRYDSASSGRSRGSVASSQPAAVAPSPEEGAPAAAREGRLPGRRSPTPPTPAMRTLAFDLDDGAAAVAEWSGVPRRPSLPPLPPRPTSSSLHSLLSPAALSLSSSSQALQPKRPGGRQASTTTASSISTTTTSNGRRPPRSSPPTSSSTPSFSVSPPAQRPTEVPPLTASLSSTSTRHSSLPSAIAAAARAEEAGVRTVFQQCLRSPRAAATATLSENDWVALVGELRRGGHRKFPPQAVLDDVARTITEEMQRSKRTEGLTVFDFERVVHTQLDEVRRDLQLNPATAAASPSSMDVAVNVVFPAHPNYCFTLPPKATEASGVHCGSGSSSVARARRSSLSSHSGMKQPSTPASQWRVLPTWCITLAALFPLEMCAVCPMPVVRYLRSVGLVNAVLEALVQRLEVEVEAMPNAAFFTPAGATASASLSEMRSQGLNAVPGSSQQQRPRGKEGDSVAASASFAAMSAPGTNGASSFMWPPRANSLMSFLMSAAAAGGGSVSAARPTSSVVLTSASRDSAPWKESPEWRPTTTEDAPCNAPCSQVHSLERGGDGLFAASCFVGDAGTRGLAASSNRQLSASAPVGRQDDQRPRYLTERPPDEITTSVVARAKARRLMDSLRRHTVPINRYECFARVEHEDEPVQKPLCFISKADLERTFGGSDDGAAADDDSDAMSDVIATLTYDPSAAADAAAAMAAETQNAQRDGGVNGHPSADGHRTVYTNQRRLSAPSPQLSRASAANYFPNVFSGFTRASTMMRRRASSPTSTPFDVDAPAAGSRATSASAALGPSGARRQHRRSPPPPPPPVPGMFRMGGVLLGALPKKQEAALVERLSHPIFDPHTMGLRAASVNATRPPSAPIAGVPPHHRTTSPRVHGTDPVSTAAAAVLKRQASPEASGELNTPARRPPSSPQRRAAGAPSPSLSPSQLHLRCRKWRSNNDSAADPFSKLIFKVAPMREARESPTGRIARQRRSGAARRRPASTAQQQRGNNNVHRPPPPPENRKRTASAEAGSDASSPPFAASRVRMPRNGQHNTIAYASKVPRPRRSNITRERANDGGRGKGGDTRTPVWYTAHHDDAAAARRHAEFILSEREERPPDRAPRPAPMSLYERQLLRQLQRAYTAERVPGN
ncbi:hypothetical protein ABB37_06410 [Leptomonas pyrrhocoris]|uniref:Uncharacterized protein n=1 Tax=Leptomonas pyrrhocoris TaxID=157538 RepID=A0A0M9FY15_LEPPY|nr:hypothetical protein ABB37_06410 [Leptomonas pyrrhocoris]XP_015656698.1 hypothetical protein ABB37_06410 [Leptomonas pyrrhocoris]KPA78258.1 hypothetical protein ABB37_06410 [Leptomonas pyrrhocoris]KPA78259.1 hypothetical protein ABB37_06410 [Leptomonas pyrrhocoris]|eukprot:XP_015656697.1 hypothetical protein ABB37_06410 [Leptomonas pyrrhocoris]